jgi:hypothetical protein
LLKCEFTKIYSRVHAQRADEDVVCEDGEERGHDVDEGDVEHDRRARELGLEVVDRNNKTGNRLIVKNSAFGAVARVGVFFAYLY